MKNIHVLLANTDRRAGNIIQAVILDVCYNQAAVDCTKIGRVDELAPYGCHPAIHLIILAPDHLLTAPSRGGLRVKLEDVLEAVRTIKNRCITPLIAVNVSPEDELALLQAGADAVLPFPFNREAFRSEVRKILKIPELVEEVQPSRWSLAALFT